MAAESTKVPEELSKGARWMIDRIDAMQADYKEALVAAVTIIQYQTQARKLRLSDQNVPKPMNQRLEQVWGRYEATRRHVEWYMKQNALHASSPSHPAIIMPTPQPPLLADQTLARPTSTVPKASPIPLAAASLMAYDNATVVPSSELPVPVLAADVQQVQSQPEQGLNQMSNFGDAAMSFGDGMDLSTLGINELQSMINSTNELFSQQQPNQNGSGGIDMSMFASLTGGQGNDTQTNNLLTSLGSAMNASAQMSQQNQDQQSQQISQNQQNQSNPQNPPVQQVQQNQQQQQQQQIQQMQQTLSGLSNTQDQSRSGLNQMTQNMSSGNMGNAQDVKALLASLGAGNAGQIGSSQTGQAFPNNEINMGGNSGGQNNNQFNFDFGSSNSGDVDLSEFAGLFPDNSGQAGTADPGQQTTASAQGQQVQQQPSEPLQQPEQQQQTQQQQPPAQTQMAPSQAQSRQSEQSVRSEIDNAVDTTTTTAAGPDTQIQDLSGMSTNEGMQEMDGNYNLGGINLDDFNFGDAGMPNVEEDEFESMFAEFT